MFLKYLYNGTYYSIKIGVTNFFTLYTNEH